MFKFDDKDMNAIGSILEIRSGRSEFFQFLLSKPLLHPSNKDGVPLFKLKKNTGNKKNKIGFHYTALTNREIGNPAYLQKEDGSYDWYLDRVYLSKVNVQVTQNLINPSSVDEYLNLDQTLNTKKIKSVLFASTNDGYIRYYWDLPTAMYAFYLRVKRNDIPY